MRTEILNKKNEKDFRKLIGNLTKDLYELEWMNVPFTELPQILLLFWDAQIVAFATIFDLEIYKGQKISIVSPRYISYGKQTEEIKDYFVKVIGSMYPDKLLDVSSISNCFLESEHLSKNEYFRINLKSSFNEYTYQLQFNNCFYVKNKNNINLLRDQIEKDFFPNIDVNKLTFKNIEANEVSKFISNIYWQDCGNSSFLGFHYFTGEDLSIMKSCNFRRDYFFAFYNHIRRV
jgi:hypothetical protein